MSKINSGATSPSGKRIVQGACQILAIFCLLLSGTACSKRYGDVPAYWPFSLGDYENQSVGRFKTSFIVDQIDGHYRGVNPGPIGVTTFVNSDDLYSTSSFGRMYAEQIMSELAMRGYDVIEMRHADAVQFISNRGEFALSRDPSSVRRERELGGVVVGTYVVSPVRVYVNARLVDPATSMVLSAGSVEMGKSAEIARMLRVGSVPSSLERIPVRHVGIATYPMAMFPSEGRQIYDLEEGGMGHGGFGAAPQFAPSIREKSGKK